MVLKQICIIIALTLTALCGYERPEMSFFRDRVRSSDIRRELGVEPLLVRIETGQLRWFGHQIRMPPGRLPLEVFQARPTGKRHRGRPRTRWRDYISRLAWEHLGVPQEELENVAGERDVWNTLLGLAEENGWMDGWMDSRMRLL